MYKPKKELGQNFLIESGIAESMVKALEMEKGDAVVEIGAGLGALTEVLVKEAGKYSVKVKAIEIDERFVGSLKERFSHLADLEIIEADILRWMPMYTETEKLKVIGSLPYYITSPILHSIVRHSQKITKCVLVMQKEVANKIAATAPQASYLSTYLHTFYKVKVLKVVPRSFFEPEPKVDGAIVVMTELESPPISKDKMMDYEEFLHNGFSKPRKMLNKVFSKQDLIDLDIDEKLRPQHVDVKKWLELFQKAGANSLK